MRLGILGGTFDPVHLGHIKMAEEARKTLKLDEVRLIPAGQPLLKNSRTITPAADRLEMLRLAVAEHSHIKISTIEIERKGLSYTVDTLAELKKMQGENDEIYFIMGWDSLAQLPQWREPKRIIEMCTIAVVPRPGIPKPDPGELESDIPGISRRVVFLEKPRVNISATNIRERAAKGESIYRLVPGPVAEYIKKHNLYQDR
jgi:nicotinate-nucleotide adenylyltransferase